MFNNEHGSKCGEIYWSSFCWDEVVQDSCTWHCEKCGIYRDWRFPCQKTVEEMVLGLGKQPGQWFESAPAPEDDGEVLIVQIDSKATPTATEQELQKRRGKIADNYHPGSQRHRRKVARKRRGSKERKKKRDKSKNGKMSATAVRYTLKRSDGGLLEGPINKKVYASYAPKRHAVAIVCREADKPGFNGQSENLVQIVVDDR